MTMQSDAEIKTLQKYIYIAALKHTNTYIRI